MTDFIKNVLKLIVSEIPNYDTIHLDSVNNDHRILIVSILLVGNIVTLFFIWLKYGKDADAVVVSSFDIPDSLSPAEARYLYYNTVDDTSLTATIIQYAEKKYININRRYGNFSIVRNDTKLPIPDKDKIVLDFLMMGKNEITLADLTRKRLKKAEQLLRKIVENQMDASKLYDYNQSKTELQYLSTMICLLLTTCIFLLFSPILMVAVIIAFLLIYVLKFIIPFIPFFSILYILPCSIMSCIFYFDKIQTESPELKFIFISLIVLNIISYIAFIFIMKKITPEGQMMIGKIEELKKHMEIVEKGRLNSYSKYENIDKYSPFLPYMVALNISNNWHDTLKDLIYYKIS